MRNERHTPPALIGPGRGRVALRAIEWISTLLSVALAAWVLFTTIGVARAGWTAIPIRDDWDRWTTYIQDHYSLAWFFREHIDHRLVVPKILLAVDHLAFHGRGWFVLIFSFCFQAVTGTILWWLSGRAYRQDRVERIALAAAIAACVFSAQQWLNFSGLFRFSFPWCTVPRRLRCCRSGRAPIGTGTSPG